MTFRKVALSLFATLALSMSVAAGAATITFDVTGIASWDSQGSANNVVLNIDLGAGAVVTGLGWDVTITPVGDSWYSEATAGFTDSLGGQGINLAPGVADTMSGDGVPIGYSSGGILSFAGAGLPDIVLADGILRIEFFEGFDDVAGAIDANWGGELTVEYSVVPLPGAAWLLISGLLSAGLLGRRKA